jgi:hypothetical protein
MVSKTDGAGTGAVADIIDTIIVIYNFIYFTLGYKVFDLNPLKIRI